MEIAKNEFLNEQLKRDDVLVPMNHIKDIFIKEDSSNYNLLVIDSLYENEYFYGDSSQNGYKLTTYKTPFNKKIQITKSLKPLKSIVKDLNIKNKFDLYKFLYFDFDKFLYKKCKLSLANSIILCMIILVFASSFWFLMR